MKLQPLELGAIFQRAMALYTRNFIPFAAAVVATIIPVAMLQYVVGVREQPQVDATIDLLQHPDRLRTEHIPLLSPETLALATASALFGYLMLAFAFGAVASGVAAYYRGEVVSLAACYRTVLVRWLSVVAVVATAVLVLASAYFASIAVIALPVFAIAAVASSLLPVLAPFAITGMLCAMAFVVLILIVTSSGTVCAVVVEGCSASSAVPLTVARTLNRRELGRTLRYAIAVGAISLVASTLADLVGLAFLSRWPGAYVALGALERTLVVPFLSIVLALYYFDVRLRHDGFDLDAEHELIAHADEPTYAPTAYLSGEERALIKRFLERRESLAPQRRRQIAARLAASPRDRVPLELRSLDDEALLERL